jgi:hypothetical protein
LFVKDYLKKGNFITNLNVRDMNNESAASSDPDASETTEVQPMRRSNLIREEQCNPAFMLTKQFAAAFYKN